MKGLEVSYKNAIIANITFFTNTIDNRFAEHWTQNVTLNI